MIKLGSKVKDMITGYAGIAVGRTEWLYGCNRIVVESDQLKDGKPLETQWFDEQRVEHVADTNIPVSPSKQTDITLGSKVKDRVTGFSGLAVAKTEWLSGNVTITIEPTSLHEGKPVDAQGFDVQRVELLETKTPPVSAQSTATAGGPQRDPKEAR